MDGVLLVCMTLATHFPLDRESGVPLGVQLATTLEGAIRNGELNAGDQLPSVRQMASLAGVNVNTVRTVYGRLEQQGLLSSEHGRGTFVRGAQPTAAGDPAADREYRRELMRQIAELERQAAYYTRHRIVGGPEPPPRKPASQLLPATELMAVRDELLRPRAASPARRGGAPAADRGRQGRDRAGGARREGRGDPHRGPPQPRNGRKPSACRVRARGLGPEVARLSHGGRAARRLAALNAREQGIMV